MGKKIVLFFYLTVFVFLLFPQENINIIKTSEKEAATFNDAISLMRLVYDENDYTDIFIENILWAAGKKLFQVTIPIQPDKINPIITREEFAYWCTQIYNLKNEKSKTPTTRKYSYDLCVSLGILSPGRGRTDNFTGIELLETFSYLDYYVKARNIKPNEGQLTIDDDYQYLPEWRQRIYKELDEQRAKELKKKNDKTNKDDKNNIKEKYIDNTGDGL